jgi:hypothetical protein
VGALGSRLAWTGRADKLTNIILDGFAGLWKDVAGFESGEGLPEEKKKN